MLNPWLLLHHLALLVEVVAGLSEALGYSLVSGIMESYPYIHFYISNFEAGQSLDLAAQHKRNKLNKKLYMQDFNYQIMKNQPKVCEGKCNILNVLFDKYNMGFSQSLGNRLCSCS